MIFPEAEGHNASFSSAGDEVRTLAGLHRDPGFYRVSWNGLTQGGARSPSGICLVRFAGPGFSLVRKVSLVR